MSIKKNVKALLVSFLIFALVISSMGMIFIKRANAYEIKTVDVNTEFQTLDGWGTSLAWWANNVGGMEMKGSSGETVRDEIMNLIYGKDGLDYNIARYNLPGGDDPTHNHFTDGRGLPGYKASADAEYDWNADHNQLWVLKEANKMRGDMINEMISYSPPYWMTIGGCSAGNTENGTENLDPSNYGAFATYIADVYEHLTKEEGIKFDYLTPMNEPGSKYWNAAQNNEGNNVFIEHQSDLFKAVMTEFDNRNLWDNVNLTGADENFASLTVENWNKLTPEVRAKIAKINTHIYDYGNQLANFELADIAKREDKKVWMSEMALGDGEHNHFDIKNALTLSKFVIDTLNDMEANAFITWQVINSEVLNRLGKYNYDLIHMVNQDVDQKEHAIDMKANALTKGDYYLTKQYYVMGQYSRYIHAGYTLVTSNDADTVVAISPDKTELVIVKTNFTNAPTEISYNIPNFTNVTSAKMIETSLTKNWDEYDIEFVNGTVSANVDPYSITTIVLKGERTGGTRTVVNDDVYSTGDELVLNKFKYNGGPTVWGSYAYGSIVYNNEAHYASDDKANVQLKFNGTGIDVYCLGSWNSGIINIDIDGVNKGKTNTYKINRSFPICQIRDLEPGEHVITLDPELDPASAGWGNNIILDCAVVYNGDVVVKNTNPLITEMSAFGDKLSIKFKPVDGVHDYTIKYGTDKANLTESKVVTDVTEAVIEGLEIGKEYFAQIEVDVEGEKLYSQIVSAVTKQNNDLGIVYYVDCGDGSVDKIDESDEVFGLNNSVEDKEFGVDPISGKKWGYYTTTAAYYNTDAFDKWQSVRVSTAPEAIGYKFELDPAEKYRVIFGFYDWWPIEDEGRQIRININDVSAREILCEKYQTEIFNDVSPAADGMLKLDLEGINDNPLLSYIRIEQMSSKNVIGVAPSAPIVLDMGAPVIGSLPNKLSVQFSDGSKQEMDVAYTSYNFGDAFDATESKNKQLAVNGLIPELNSSFVLIVDVKFVDTSSAAKPAAVATVDTLTRKDTSLTVSELALGGTLVVVDQNNKVLVEKAIDAKEMTLEGLNLTTTSKLSVYQIVGGVKSNAKNIILPNIVIFPYKEGFAYPYRTIRYDLDFADDIKEIKMLNHKTGKVTEVGHNYVNCYNNGTYTIMVTAVKGYQFAYDFEVTDVDELDFNVNNNPTNWINSDADLTFDINVTSGVKTVTVVDGDVNTDITTALSYKVTENKNIKLLIETVAGNVIERDVVIDKIDKVAPTLGIKTEYINGQIAIRFEKNTLSAPILSINGVEYLDDYVVLPTLGKYTIELKNQAGVKVTKIVDLTADTNNQEIEVTKQSIGDNKTKFTLNKKVEFTEVKVTRMDKNEAITLTDGSFEADGRGVYLVEAVKADGSVDCVVIEANVPNVIETPQKHMTAAAAGGITGGCTLAVGAIILLVLFFIKKRGVK